MSHDGISQGTRTDQEGVSAWRQDENTKEPCAVIIIPNGDVRAAFRMVEQMRQSGIWNQPIGVYKVSKLSSNGSMEEIDSNEHHWNSGARLIACDTSNLGVFALCTGMRTPRSASSAVSADLSYFVSSEARTRGPRESGLALTPISVANDNAAASLPCGSQVLGRSLAEDDTQLSVFYVGRQGRDCAFIAQLDTGSEVTVARLSIAERGNVRICKLHRPVRLFWVDGNTALFSDQVAWLDLCMQRRPHKSQCLKVYLLADHLLPGADAYMGRDDARKLGMKINWN